MYTQNLGEAYRGPYALQRVENLTRWIALVAATTVILAVYAQFLSAVVKYNRQYKGAGEEGKLQRTRLSKVLSRFCDFRFVIRLIVLHKVGRYFRSFHEALEKREADFTALPQQIRILRQRLISLCSDSTLDAIRDECSGIIKKCTKIKHIRAEQRRVDAPVRLRDYDEVAAREVAGDTTMAVVELFEEEAEIRFPTEQSEVVSAFSVLDPENFPELTGLSVSEADKQMSAYGVEKMETLAKHYGTAHPDSEVSPPLDREAVPLA